MSYNKLWIVAFPYEKDTNRYFLTEKFKYWVLRSQFAGECLGSSEIQGSTYFPQDFLAVHSTVWIPGTVLVIWEVMWKWSIEEAAIKKILIENVVEKIKIDKRNIKNVLF